MTPTRLTSSTTKGVGVVGGPRITDPRGSNLCLLAFDEIEGCYILDFPILQTEGHLELITSTHSSYVKFDKIGRSLGFQ